MHFFLITVFVFALVIINFLRWIDRIARLGRLGPTISKVEATVAESMIRNRQSPTLGGRRAKGRPRGRAIRAKAVGYIQRIEVAQLQELARKGDFQVTVVELPGAFVTPGAVLACIEPEGRGTDDDIDVAAIQEAFLVCKDRTFDEDPRFGLIALSEIASRALSPAVNDPGTAIDVISTHVRLFCKWDETEENRETGDAKFDRVAVPELSLDDMFDDAFNALARDGAGTLEVAIRLQKAFLALADLGSPLLAEAARSHAQLALRHAEAALRLPEEVAMLQRVCGEEA